MKILFTGPSGAGKTTFANHLRAIFPNTFDLDIIGRWDKKSQKFLIAVNALKGLLTDFPDIVCFGVSDNMSSIIPLFDKVILIDQPYTQEHDRALLNREKERSIKDGTSWRKTYEQKSAWLGKSIDWAKTNGIIYHSAVKDLIELQNFMEKQQLLEVK